MDRALPSIGRFDEHGGKNEGQALFSATRSPLRGGRIRKLHRRSGTQAEELGEETAVPIRSPIVRVNVQLSRFILSFTPRGHHMLRNP